MCLLFELWDKIFRLLTSAVMFEDVHPEKCVTV